MKTKLRFTTHTSVLVMLLMLMTGLTVQAQVTVSGALSGNGTYASLRLAFNAINGASQTNANIAVSITADTNEGANTAQLNAGTWNSLTITPVGVRTITGATTAGNPLINLNGVTKVTINGLNTGGNSLAIRNTTASGTNGTAAIRFIADASNNIVTNCTLTASCSGTATGVVFFSTGTTTGNDNNTISNCNITSEGTNYAANLIYSNGTSAAVDNRGNVIQGNNLYDNFNAAASHAAIFVNANNSSWTINNNKVFQTATRAFIANMTVYGIRIASGTGGYTISGNTVGYASASGTGTMTLTSNNTTLYRAIELNGNATVSSIQGNTVAGINFTTTASNTATNGVFTGINVTAGASNIGTTTGNVIGSATSTNSIVVTSTAAVTTATRIVGIYITSSLSSTLQNNTVAGIGTAGSTSNGYSIMGIYTSGTSGSYTVSYNNIGSTSVTDSLVAGTSGTTTTGVCNIYGIYNDATGAQTISNNNILRCRAYGTSGSFIYGIQNAGGANQPIIIDYNLIDGLTLSGTNVMRPILNSVGASTLSISNNTIRNCVMQNASIAFTGIQNSSSVTNSITINNNILGDASNNLVSANVAMTGAFNGILNSSGSATASLSIQYNTIRGIMYSVNGSNTHTLISNSFATLSQNISYNTFNNLSIASSGNVTFLSNNISSPASGTQAINNNSIVTAFNKTVAGGTVTLFTSTATSNSTASIVNSNNNFSNITVTGATTIAGWVQTDAGSLPKTINNNTFSNWTGGSSGITVISASGFGGTSTLNTNTITSISGQGSVTGINLAAAGNATSLSVNGNTISALSSTGTGNNVYGIVSVSNCNSVLISNNIVNTLSSTGASAALAGIYINGGTGTHQVYGNSIYTVSASGTTAPVVSGILTNAGTAIQVYKNKIYDLTKTAAISAGTVSGISCTGSTTTVSVYNNLIGDLKSPATNLATAAVRGISIGSTNANTAFNVYYNTVLLNATSTGTNFGTCALYHAANGTATTATLTLINNILIDKSTPNGTGVATAIYRTATTTANFSTSSNFNLLYAGVPSASRMIYQDNTTGRQTLQAYQAAFSPRDYGSSTEDVAFLSTVGNNANFLKPNTAVLSNVESGGTNITGYTTDYAGNIRQGNPGYTGSGLAPDLGAYEQEGLQSSDPIIVSGALIGNGSYQTLGSAFSALNAGAQTNANITVYVRADTDEGTTSAQLNAGTWSSVIIRPIGNRTITGATTAGGALISLSGADNVTVDGLNTGGNALTLQNTTVSATSGTSTLRFIGDAVNNTFTNLTIVGSTISTGSGVITFSTGATTGNDNNTISNCTIKPYGSNLPVNAIYAFGSASPADNSGILIENNNIQDCFNASNSFAAIYLANNNSGWTIRGNKIYQTNSRTITAAITVYGIRINSATGGGYNITNNVIGYANANGTGVTAYDGAFTHNFRAIELSANATVSSIQGNTIAGITYSTTNANVNGAGAFAGIVVLAGNANVGTITGNIIGSSTTASSILFTSTATTSTRVVGIYVTSTGTCAIQNNVVSGISTGASAGSGYSIMAINSSGAAGNFTISGNYIGSASLPNGIAAGTSGVTTTGVCSVYGIFNDATGSVNITNNTINNCSAYGTGASFNYGISHSPSTTSTSAALIDNNSIYNGYVSGSAGARGIQVTAVNTTLTITNNTVRGFVIDNASAQFFGIYNSSANANTITISNNTLGDNTAGLVTFNVGNTNTSNAICNIGGTSACNLIIQYNTIKGWVYNVTSTAAPTLIANTAVTLSQNISNNVFDNLSLNTSGNVIVIGNSVALPASGSQVISYNSVNGSLAKTAAGGSLTLFSTAATSATGATIFNTNNNFSNVSVTGATSLTGWNQVDLGPVSKTITNNTFSNWTGGTSAVIVMNLNGFGATSTVSNNVISNITGQNTVSGIVLGATGTASTLTVDGNSISGLSSTGTGGNVTGLSVSNPSTVVNISNAAIDNLTSSGSASIVVGVNVSGVTTLNLSGSTFHTLTSSGNGSPTVSGVTITSGTAINVFNNKFYNFNQTTANSGGTTFAINCPGGTTVQAYNNIIGDLKASQTNSNAAIRAIAVTSSTATSTYAFYHNTIYLNASSTGANFGTAAIYHSTNATASTGALILRNNIIINNSTPAGTGITAAFQRSSTTLTNYDSSSNNNLWYAGTPSTSSVLLYDGTNKDQTLAAFKSRVGTRDTASQTENTALLFQSTTGSNANYLRLAAGTTSFAESAAVLITSPNINIDYWGIGRPFAAPVNYGTAPDIGASEFDGFINCTTPTNQPTALVVGAIGGSSVAASFTAATGAPSGYLVVRSIGALSANPVDGTAYTTGSTLGNGTVVQLSSSTTFTASGLNPNTTYTFTMFSYNNAVTCGGGPKFYTTSPLTGTATTCSATPTGSATQGFCGSSTVANLAATGTAIKWYTAATGGTALSSSTALVNGNIYYASQTVSGCESPVRLAVTVSIGTGSIGGSVAANQTICQGDTPSSLTLTGQTGTVLKWQSSNNVGFTSPVDIANTSTTLNGASIGAISASTYYRAVVQDGGCSAANSSVVLITVTPTPVAGTLSANQTICAGTQPANLNLTGSSGSIAKWQWATQVSFASPTDVNNTSTSLSGAAIGQLSAARYYRVVLQNGSCAAVYTDPVFIAVDQAPVGGSIAADQTICSGSTPADLTLTGYSGTIQKWQSANNSNFTSATDIANTTTTLNGATMGTQTATRYYRAVIENGVCPVAYANYATVSVVTTTWNGSAWDNGLPADNKTIAFTGNYTSTSDISGCAMSVSNNAVVVIGAGFDVTLHGALTVANGSNFTLSNNANLIQSTDVTNSGNINVQRSSAPMYRLDYTLWSSPVTGSQSLLNFSPQTLTNRFYTYNAATTQYNAIADPSTTPFANMTGYLIRVANNWVPFGGAAPAVSWTGTFSGVPNNGPYTRSNLVDGGSSTYRYNAIGNPYPSAVRIADFINANSTAITGTLWFWRKINDASNQTSYSTCTSAGCTLSNGITYADQSLISTGQGFLVEVLAGQNTVSFTNDMRSSSNVNQFFKQSTNHRFYLDLNDSNQQRLDQFMATYLPQGQYGYQAGLDGTNFEGKSNALYSNADQHALTIDARPEFDVEDRIALDFKTTQSGMHSLSLAQVEGLFDQQDIYVEDQVTHAIVNLKEGPYRFLAQAGTHNQRFVLRYTKPEQTQKAVQDVLVYTQNQEVAVQSIGCGLSEIKVFDLRGALVTQVAGNAQNIVMLPLESVANQVLLVEVLLTNGHIQTFKVMH